MRQTLWSATLAAIVCGLTIGLLAQAPSSSQAQTDKPVTLSGCLERAPQSDAGAPPSSSAAATASTKFVLTNASATASGAVGTAGAAKPATRYQLDVEDTKVSPHIGHKVEVTGILQAPSSASPSGASPSMAAAPRLKVNAVKMVAATCP